MFFDLSTSSLKHFRFKIEFLTQYIFAKSPFSVFGDFSGRSNCGEFRRDLQEPDREDVTWETTWCASLKTERRHDVTSSLSRGQRRTKYVSIGGELFMKETSPGACGERGGELWRCSADLKSVSLRRLLAPRAAALASRRHGRSAPLQRF